MVFLYAVWSAAYHMLLLRTCAQHHVALHCCLDVYVYLLQQKSHDLGFCSPMSKSVSFNGHQLACHGIQYHIFWYTVIYIEFWVLVIGYMISIEGPYSLTVSKLTTY